MRLSTIAFCLVLSACERGGKYDPLAIESLDSKVRTVLAVEAKLNEGHPYEGVKALTFIQGLKREGFECRAQYRELVSFSQTAEAKITTVPWIVCVKAPAMIEPCSELTVGLDFPTERSSDLRSLVSKLGSLETAKPGFACEINSTDAEAKKRIALAAKQGHLIPVD
ncbi:hypothetical protein HZF09_18845 [Ramlibacter sp. CGMCC 1.13660]|nr:hypothetical protein [Ramlibacter sp. CGMCC 1.13660]MBA2964195.1 hypothetical protein [Ramlibacter sp. CGMCC 1.13660]